LEQCAITPQELHQWETALNIQLPLNEAGEKHYSRQHLNLFRNIKKHLTLGRSLREIACLIKLPPVAYSSPKAPAKAAHATMPQAPKATAKAPQLPKVVLEPKVPAATPTVAAEVSTPPAPTSHVQQALQGALAQLSQSADFNTQVMAASFSQSAQTVAQVETVAQHTAAGTSVPSVPHAITALNSQLGQALQQAISAEAAPAPLTTPAKALATQKQQRTPQEGTAPVALLEKVLGEKDALQHKLIEAEKLNSHLYNVNHLFNRKVKELDERIAELQKTHQPEQQIQMLQDKAKLQQQVMEVERQKVALQQEATALQQQVRQLQQALSTTTQQLQGLSTQFSPKTFVGVWHEALTLKAVVFDTFGLNVEAERQHYRHIETIPSRVVGNASFITTHYSYPENPLWQRMETLSVVALPQNTPQEGNTHLVLKGELLVDYAMDGTIVCRALYEAALTPVESTQPKALV
jgi:DNA-binding transcriptional MerR regulator